MISSMTSGTIWHILGIIVPCRCHGNHDVLACSVTLTPTCKTETLGYSSGLFQGLWARVVTWPVGRYGASDPWAIPGPGPCATQTTGCASERRCHGGPSLRLQAGQGDLDGPPGCRRHPVWNGMYLSAAASWQCALWDAPVAVTVSPGSAPRTPPPILRRTARAGCVVCARAL